MADAHFSSVRQADALRSCAKLGFIFLLTSGFWTGAFWFARLMVQTAG